MGLRNKGILILFAGAVVLFLGGLVRLFELGFEIGDTYPPYSSLRSDPVGGRALYGALQSLKDITVRRNLEPLAQVGEGRNKTLFVFGSNLRKDPEDVIKTLEGFAADGGRLVITFYPVADERRPRSATKSEQDKQNDKDSSDEKKEGTSKDEDENKGSGEKKKMEGEPWFTKMVSIEDRWGLSFSFLRPPRSKESDFLEVAAMRQEASDRLPASLSWHSTLFFDKLIPSWRVLYSWDGHAVMIERPWVRGTIVLCSDSYFLSNEAMRRERYPALLAWLVGPSSTVIFDETHFGVQERQGIMTLVRKYRLDRPLAALILLALLFLWKNALSLVPKRDAATARSGAMGKDSIAGMVNLLRRSIPTQKILPVCVEEWNRSLDPKPADKRERIQRVVDREMSLPSREHDPVEAYRTICAILAERD